MPLRTKDREVGNGDDEIAGFILEIVRFPKARMSIVNDTQPRTARTTTRPTSAQLLNHMTDHDMTATSRARGRHCSGGDPFVTICADLSSSSVDLVLSP